MPDKLAANLIFSLTAVSFITQQCLPSVHLIVDHVIRICIYIKQFHFFISFLLTIVVENYFAAITYSRRQVYVLFIQRAACLFLYHDDSWFEMNISHCWQHFVREFGWHCIACLVFIDWVLFVKYLFIIFLFVLFCFDRVYLYLVTKCHHLTDFKEWLPVPKLYLSAYFGI